LDYSVTLDSGSTFLTKAQNRQNDASLELARAVVDVFIPEAQRLREMDRARFIDILGKLIFTIEMDVRLNLVDSLASAGHRDIAIEHYLSDDHVEIARTELVYHSALRNTDLLSGIKNRTDEYHLSDAVQRLHHSGERAEIEAPNLDVIESLLRHSDSSIARRAMEYLVAETKRTDRFEEPVVSRQDIPAPFVEKLHWLVAAALRSSLLSGFEISQMSLDHSLENAVGRSLAATDENQGAHVRAARLAQLLNEAGDVTDAFLVRCLRQSRLLLLAAGLAARGTMSLQNVWPLLLDRSLASFIVLLRAVNVSRESTMVMISLLFDAQGFRGFSTALPVQDLMNHYDSLTDESLNSVMAQWRRSSAFQAALDALDNG
jgi:Uncharacterised protein conserved in bacteria (DUF2336)